MYRYLPRGWHSRLALKLVNMPHFRSSPVEATHAAGAATFPAAASPTEPAASFAAAAAAEAAEAAEVATALAVGPLALDALEPAVALDALAGLPSWAAASVRSGVLVPCVLAKHKKPTEPSGVKGTPEEQNHLGGSKSWEQPKSRKRKQPQILGKKQKQIPKPKFWGTNTPDKKTKTQTGAAGNSASPVLVVRQAASTCSREVRKQRLRVPLVFSGGFKKPMIFAAPYQK